MKKVLGYIFKDWNIFDYAVPVLYAVYIIMFKHYLPYSLAPALFGICLIFSAIYFPKNTILGYAVTLGSMGCLAYYEFSNLLYGSFIATIAIGCVAVYSMLQLILKKDTEKEKFDKWDYIILAAGLVVSAFPSYLLMIHLDANVVIAQAVQVVAALAIVFLKLKNSSFGRLAYLCAFAMELVSFTMIIISLRVEVASFAGTIIMLFLVSVKENVMILFKRKPKVKETQEKEVKEK